MAVSALSISPDTGERRSPSREAPASSATGLPILSIEPLSTRERRTLAEMARTARLLADRLEIVANAGTVPAAMNVVELVDRLGLCAAQAMAELGRGR